VTARPRDYVPLAAAGTSAGILTGTAVTALGLWLVRTVQIHDLPATNEPDLASPAAMILLVGTLAGLFTAGTVTWRLLTPIGSTYRQGGLGLVAAFATIVVVTVLGLPLDLLVGRWGLLALALVAGVAGWRLAGRARRAALDP